MNAGPKYQYEYASDHIHLTAIGYRRLGHKYAEAYFQVAVRRQEWRLLQPNSASSVTRNGLTISVKMDVPFPPFRWDERRPVHQDLSSPWHVWQNGHGFEVYTRNNVTPFDERITPVPIESVTLDKDRVLIHLGKTPGEKQLLFLAYAFRQDASVLVGGQDNGRHGHLHDSDVLTELTISSILNGW